MSRSLRFWNLISHKGAELGHSWLLNINSKGYMDAPMTLSHLTLSDLERSISKSLRFQRLISRKATVLGHILLLNIIGNQESNTTITFFTLSDLEMSNLNCRKWPKIDTCIVRYCLRDNPTFQLIYKSICRKLPMSYQLLLSSRTPRSMDLLCTSFCWNFRGPNPGLLHTRPTSYHKAKRSLAQLHVRTTIHRSPKI